ncbi:hypothetical protein KY348_00520 [Candidatus Woesearchaeota archaeon]|nr:hypothetical protein [Candidatus Woesearchaeota archaeon]
MPKKKDSSPVFEIFVVLAIVAIVAVTGQVLLRYENTGSSANAITGFAVAEYEEEMVEEEFLDVGVDDIKVNPPSPLIGEPFEIRVIVANKGFVEINTPFYVQAKLIPNAENVKPTLLNSVITQILKPGETSTAVFRIATVTKEGPMKIIATADSTAKLGDDNPSNDQRSKTIILTNQ